MAESEDPEGTCSLQRTDGDFCFSTSPAGFKNLVSKSIGGVLFSPVTLSKSYINNRKEP